MKDESMKLNVTITKTATGIGEYIQIMSDDTISVNVVLVAEKIEVRDSRPAPKMPKTDFKFSEKPKAKKR